MKVYLLLPFELSSYSERPVFLGVEGGALALAGLARGEVRLGAYQRTYGPTLEDGLEAETDREGCTDESPRCPDVLYTHCLLVDLDFILPEVYRGGVTDRVCDFTT